MIAVDPFLPMLLTPAAAAAAVVAAAVGVAFVAFVAYAACAACVEGASCAAAVQLEEVDIPSAKAYPISTLDMELPS